MQRLRLSFLTGTLIAASSFEAPGAAAEPAGSTPSSLAVARAGSASPTPTRPPGSAPSPASSPSSPASAEGEDGVSAGLTPSAAVVRGTAFYEAGQYDQCASQLGGVLGDPAKAAELSPRAREQAHVYRAACLIAQSKTKEADDEFRAAIRDNPQMALPNAIVFPPPVIERFVIVRTTLFEEIRRVEEERARRERDAAASVRRRAEEERARVARLEKLAGEETLVVQNRRWLASVPFGVGQFQNREYFLGAVFLSSEVLLVGTAVTAALIELRLNSEANGGRGFTRQDQVDQLNTNLRVANEVALIATGSFVAVAAAGILQAHLSFVPEFPGGVRARSHKAKAAMGILGTSSIQPAVGPTTGGATLGVIGRF